MDQGLAVEAEIAPLAAGGVEAARPFWREIPSTTGEGEGQAALGRALGGAAAGVENLLGYAHEGSKLLFGNLLAPENGGTAFMLTALPDTVDWADVTKVVILGLGLSLLATLYPSWRAARTDPVEALRHE